MILTMAYLLLIAVLLGIAALLGERLCTELGCARRGSWLAALVASVTLPAYAIIFAATETHGAPIFSLPLLPDFVPAFNRMPIEAIGPGATSTTSFSWPDWQTFSAGLVVFWAVASSAMLLVCFLAGLRLRRVVRQSQTMSIGDQEVLLSDSLGPAVLGLIRPRIVLPRWLAEQESALRTYVLSHEREHIAARDQLTLFAALLIVALMPWNIALWWQLRRLRKAIEVDCDSRVLREGVNAHEYSEALLTVGRRSTRAPFASVALTEAVSDLEKRIRIMMDKARDFSLVGFGMRSLLFVSVLGLALAVNAPLAHQAADAKNIDTSLRIEVTEKFSAVEACFEQNDFDCTLSILTELAESSDLTVYEAAQVQQGIATVGHSIDDPAVSMAAYEQILALPGEKVPDGLIHRAAQNLARLYLQNDRVNEGREMYDRYLALPTMTPRSRDYYLLAAILYQVDRHQDAIAPLRQAIATSGL